MREPTRREVLASTVAIGAAGLAGCVSGGDDDDTGNGDDAGSGNGDDTGSGNGDDTGSGNGDDTGSGNGDDTGSGNGDDTGSGNGDDTGSGNEPDVSIETVTAECGSAEDETADVEFGEDAITVTGTTPAPNPCHQAHVESVSVEDGSFSLTVNVREDLGDGEACVDCLGAIEYEAQIRPDDAPNVTEGTVEHVQGGTYGVGVTRDSDEGSSDGSGSSGVADASIRTTNAGCQSGTGDDEVTLERESGVFVVDGEISVPTPCHEATLGAVELDGGRLTVDIGLESTSEICQECLGLIEYEASIDLTDPDSVDTVVVTHPEDERFTLDPAGGE